MRSTDFFATHPVFTRSEYVAARVAAGRSELTSDILLGKHLHAGHLLRIRRGLYASVPPGTDPKRLFVDPYLVATKLADDAVVAYHAALQFHGSVYSMWNRFHYLTSHRAKPMWFQGLQYVPVLAPVAIRSQPDFGGEVVTEKYRGGAVRVTTLERSLVDVFDAPDKAGDWEEIWRSLEMTEFFGLDAVFDYAIRLKKSLTIARLGFYLEQRRDELMLEDRHLEKFYPYVPSQPRYFDSKRETGKLVPHWNLIVPESVMEQTWEEVL